MANSVNDAQAFARAAEQGLIGIDPDAAQTVLNKVRNGKDRVENLLNNAESLAVAPQLGANVVGTAMGKKFADRAAGNSNSYRFALNNLHAHYEAVEKALVAAMKNYEHMEESVADSFRQTEEV